MRVIVHDYSGHPFQVQLSRELAKRGHEVLHQHFQGFQTPKGALVRRDDDAPTFDVQGLDLDTPFAKTQLVKRVFQEREYGRRALASARAFRPDVFISSNMPLDPLGMLQRGLQADGCRFVLWWQDIYSVAMGKILPRKLPGVGNLVAQHYRRLERRVCREADAIVCITDDFIDVMRAWGVDVGKAMTIENWAPLDEIRPLERDNAWAREQGLVDRPVLLYAGTLGLKHNPELLWRAAERLRTIPGLEQARVVVISEGVGADWLSARMAAQPDVPLALLPFQPYERFSEVLASASVVAAILEPDAGVFSVPSKVLSYLSSGRAILLAAPAENLASRTIERIGAGEVVAPDALDAFADRAALLLADAERCAEMGGRGRAHAETAFAIEQIADRFETLFPASRSALAA
jgi:glycosyltransferase involved in cell wall biosynthesis